VSNSKKTCFIYPFSFNKLVSEPGSVDQERPTMAKKKKKNKKKKKKKKKVLKLKKALYGLKQASRAYNTRIDTYFKENGFKKCPYEHALYAKKNGGNVLFVALYVDDLIFMGNNDEMIEEFKGTLTRKFEMTDLRLMKFFLGLEVRQVFLYHRRHMQKRF
jgi:Reverse transcriptase (RNA-dependent DNA polymerase)